MGRRDLNRLELPLIVAGILFLALGVWGAADIRNQAHLGVATDPTGTITQVDVGSAADRAGLKVGDVVKRINDVDVSDTRALIAMASGTKGQTQTFVVTRAGENITLSATLEALPARDLVLALAGALIGWCFLATGLWAFVARPARHTLLLALAGLGMGFGPMPEAHTVALRLVVNFLLTVSAFSGVSLLLHFALLFPRPKPFVDDPIAMTWLYVPAAASAAYVAFLLIVRPTMTSGMSRLTGVLIPGVFFLYLAGTLVAFIHSYVTTTAPDRARFGLNLVLVAALVGFLPVALSTLVSSIAPRVVLPGGDYYFLTLAVLPLVLAWVATTAAVAETEGERQTADA